jgi:hypothetical protein
MDNIFIIISNINFLLYHFFPLLEKVEQNIISTFRKSPKGLALRSKTLFPLLEKVQRDWRCGAKTLAPPFLKVEWLNLS